MINILYQHNNIYGKPNSAALKLNDKFFRSPFLVADAPKVLFHQIEDCAEVALLGKNPYTDKQLVQRAICLKLGTGLYYVRTFKDRDLLAKSQPNVSQAPPHHPGCIPASFKCHGAHIGTSRIYSCTSLNDEQCIWCFGEYSKQLG